MTKGVKSSKEDVDGRILISAAGLFASFGYNGVSTRDIANRAGVNEVTIYRHYPRKRDLYFAVLTAELQQVKLGGDLLSRIVEAGDAKEVLARTLDLISTTLLSRPELLRLIQYSSLELGNDIDPLLRKYLGELVEVVTRYLEPWVKRGELRCASAKALVFSLIGISFCHRPLYRLFPTDSISLESVFSAFVDSIALE